MAINYLTTGIIENHLHTLKSNAKDVLLAKFLQNLVNRITLNHLIFDFSLPEYYCKKILRAYLSATVFKMNILLFNYFHLYIHKKKF